jgi:SOS-response transcriptional repressor LexA
VQLRISEPMQQRFTKKQGQHLAIIHNCAKVQKRPPTRSEIQDFFRTAPSSVHQMILRLEEKGLLRRVAGEPRSLEVVVPVEELPALE